MFSKSDFCASMEKFVSFDKSEELTLRFLCESVSPSYYWRKRSIPTHSGWLYPLTFDAGKGLKEA